MHPLKTISRRDALIGFAAAGLAGGAVQSVAGYDFSKVTPVEGTRVQTEIEIDGNLLVGPDAAKAKRLGLRAKAEMKYACRSLPLPTDSQALRSVREYEICKAEIKLHDRESTGQLHPERTLIVSQLDGGRWRVFSPIGPLTREETDLIKSGVNVDAAPRLLPPGDTPVATAWTIERDALAAFLGLDGVTTSDVTATSAVAKDRPTTLEVSAEGKVTGTVDGLDAQIEVKLKVAVDTAEHRIRWVTAAVREKREAGNARPGFETLSKIKSVVQPMDLPASLANDGLKGLAVDFDVAAYTLRLRPNQGGFESFVDPRWHMVVDKGDMTVLRLVERNAIHGQANIAIYPKGSGSTADSTAAFRAEVERSLADNQVEIVEADDATTSNGLRRLRIKAVGKLEGYDVQWLQYLISDDRERRAALSFTCQVDKVDRFGDADLTLVDTFRFAEDAAEAPSTATKPSVGAKSPSAR